MSSLPTIYGGSSLNGWGSYASEVPTPKPDAKATPGDGVVRRYGGWGSGTGWATLGYAKAPLGNDAVWRLMSYHPTLALAYAVITGPIMAGIRTVKILDANGQYVSPTKGIVGDGVISSPEDQYAEVLEATFRPHWSYLMASSLECLRYGRWLNEVLWTRRNGLTVVDRFKSFLPSQAQLLRDKYGNFAGYRYLSEDRGPEDAFLAVNQAHIDPLFGVSRFESCREEWWEKIQAKIAGAKLDQKASGIIPIVKGPGDSTNASDGTVVSGADSAKKISDALARGEPVFMPQYLFDPENMQGNPDAAKYTAFDVDFFDAGNTGAHAAAILAKLAYIDSELFMAMRRPPREALEGQNGTKAEAGTHGDIGTLDSELIHGSIVEQLNAGPVRTMNVTNRGVGAANQFIFVPSPLQDTLKEFNQKIAELLMPTNAATVDTRRLFTSVQLPIVSEEEAAAAKEQAAADKAANAPAIPKPPGANDPTQLARSIEKLSDLIDFDDESIALDRGEDGQWVTIDGAHVFINGKGEITKGPSHLVGKNVKDVGKGKASGSTGDKASKPSGKRTKEKEAAPKTKSEIAKQSATYVGKDIQRYAEEHNEPQFAKSVGGLSYKDNEPVDVVAGKGGTVEHGIELKTMVRNKASKLTMDKYAQARKVEWESEKKATFHTVVIDDRSVYNAKGDGKHDESKRSYYYRRGIAGSAQISAMHKVKNVAEIKKLMAMDESQLPSGAQRTDAKMREGKWKPFSDSAGRGYKNSKSGEIARPKK